MSKKSLSELFKRWSGRGRLASVDTGARNRTRLGMEEFEPRLVPATLPPVTSSDTRVIQNGAFAPQAVADPTNPNLIVVISASSANAVGASLIGQVTRDGGQTWYNFPIANPDTGLFAGPGGVTLTMVNTPSVAFSRTGDLYVIWTSTTADQTTAGRLRVASFTVKQTEPNQNEIINGQPVYPSGVATLNPSQELYEWLLQDPVFNPTIAVDNNLDEYTDPDTAAPTLQDTMLRANNSGKTVYVAWNTGAVTPTLIGHTPIPPANLNQEGWTPNAIFAAASRDRGRTWSTPVPVNDGGHRVFFDPALPPGGGIAPQIRFTPGDLNAETTDTPGRLQFFWQAPNGLGILDESTPDEDFNPATNNIDVETSTVYQSPSGPPVAISEPGLDPNSGPDFPVASTSTITVAIDSTAASNNGAFFNFLTDLDVTVALTHPHLNQLRVVLIPPNAVGGPITLVANRIGADGNVVPTGNPLPDGLTDNNDVSGNSGLGVTNQGAGARADGTVFDSEAARRIHDGVNVAAPRSATSGYIAHYRPEYGTLASYYGRSVTQLNGTWTLSVTDFRDDDRNAGFTPNVPIPFINSWSMKMSSLISNSGFGADSTLSPFIAGPTGNANLGGGGGSNATATGFNAGFSYAYDNTLGSFSPFSGRLYTAFTDGNIQVAYSDDQGASWSFPTRVNDDFSSDNFSEGSRSNFMPNIAVDSVTGTVVVTWYDARWDASNARVTTYIATSIDGGDTWSVQDRTAWLNNSNNATDQFTRSVVSLEPMPTNLRAMGAREAGQRQSVLAAGGQIHAFWTGNENSGAVNIYTATVRTSAGPRIVDNDTLLNTDQGAVTIDAPGGYNNTFTNDGTRRIDGFTVVFDRGTRLFDERGGVDVSTFTPDDVTVLFRAPGTDRSVPATRIPIASIVPLDPITTQQGFPDDATTFFVQFATPQTAIGTYSYSVGPDISDRNRSQRRAVFTPSDTPMNIPDLGMLESTISVPRLANNPLVANMEVKVDIAADPNNLGFYLGDLKLTLFGPDLDGPGPALPLSVVLSNRRGVFGDNYSNTRFLDAAIPLISSGTPPFSGTFVPEEPLATFNGLPLSGNWTLRVEDLEGRNVGSLLGWSITFLNPGGVPITVSESTTVMDQDGDARTNEIGTAFDDNLPKNAQPPHLYTDAYTAPGSSGSDEFNLDPFAGPVAPNTLPLIQTGPHLVLVGNPGERAVVTFATRDAVDPAILHVTLDRAIDITTFDGSDVISVVSASGGPVTSKITNVIPTNDANEIASKFDIVYGGATLPTGKYTVSLGTDFLVADGMFRNTTSNQMLVRFDRDIDPASFTVQNVLRITGPIGDIQDVQDITVLGTAGTFTVTFTDATGSQTTPDLPFDVPASGGIGATASLQNAIASLTKVGSGNVVVTVENLIGGGRKFHVTFTGLLRSNQLPMTAVGTGGTSATVEQVGITVTPVPTTVNAVTGGARAFFVTYPRQNLSGPYTIEFGQDPLGRSIHAVDVPQLVTVHYTAPIAATLREGSVGVPEIQTVRVVATSGTFALTLNGETTVDLAVGATAAEVKAAIDALPGVGPGGGSVIVSATGPAGDITYTIQFSGTLASSNMSQITAAFTSARNDLTVVFNKDIPAGRFTTANIVRVTGPNGDVPLANIASVQTDSARQFRIVFTAGTLVAGQYVVDFETNEIQTVTVVGGTAANTFTLTFNGATTNPIPVGSTAAVVQSELNQLFTIGANGVTVTSAAVAGGLVYTVEFGGPNLQFVDQPPMTATGSGFADPVVDTVQDGGAGTLAVANSGPAMDMNFNAGLDTLRGDDPASQDLDPITYRSTVAAPIAPATTELVGTPPNQTVQFNPAVSESYIVIDDDFIIRQSTLEQIRVLMNISHPDVRDLTIDLVPPDAIGGAPIRLFTGALATNTSNVASANFSNTILVDRVGDPNVTNIENGTPPFLSGGSAYTPQTPLSRLVGKSAKGVWTLRVLNEGENVQTQDPNFTAGDPIEITNWTITLPRALTIEAQRFDRTSGVPIEPQPAVVVSTTQQGGPTASETQTLTVTGSTGVFGITFNNVSTGLLARNSTALQVQTALNALSTISGAGGSVTVTSTSSGNGRVFTVTFGGTLANTNVTQMTTFVPQVTDSTIEVPVNFAITETTLSQIQMLMNITHPNVRELDIDLIPPAATGVGPIRIFDGATLAPTAPNQSANFTNTRLVNRVNDPSAPSIQSAVPPFNAGEAGFFSPQTPLTALIGKSTLGTWTLRVTNRGTNAPSIDPNFNPNVPIQIANWSLTFPKQVPTTGLGQARADRFQAGFRIFTQDPTNDLTQTTWTPVGPAPTNETANSGRISAMAVDPTDPTGNTVYVAVAGGGIWKTTDFLNTSSALQNGGLVPRGPSYVPLTDFGPTSAVNVSSIAVFPRNSDPHQTIILALTGEPATEGDLAGPLTQSGVGVIRSLDGGKTWQVLDSTRNVDAAGNVVRMSDQNTRDHLFVGATGHKIIVDPTAGKDGGVIVYMALSGNANQNGLWRSLNGGNTWTRVMAGDATDVALAAGSANQTDPATGETVYQGNLQKLYSAFRSTPVGSGPGVYQTDSAPAAFSLDFMAGGTQNPLIRDVSIPTSPQITTLLPASFPNSGRRTLLAVPALSDDPLKNSFLKDWVYAMTTDVNNDVQLYMTKDAGAHWTRVRIPVTVFGDPTNNESTTVFNPQAAISPRGQLDVGTLGDYAMAITVDPTNPYIVYMAGSGGGSIRLDLTKMRDAHNFTFYNNSDVVLGAASTPQFPNPALSPTTPANPAFTTEINGQSQTIGGLQPQIFIPPGQITGVPGQGDVLIGGSNFDFYEDENGDPVDFLNLFGGRDYNQPFTSNSLIRVEGTGNFPQSILAGFFVNDGADISWNFFTDILDPNVPDQTGDFATENRFFAINTHSILSFTDPVTGKTRLIFGTDDGVFTGVDSSSTVGSGTLTDGIGFSTAVRGNRNGNLQVSQFYNGAVQPSQLAADLAGALFYGMGDESGFPVSSPNVLASGDLNWRGPTGHGASVLVDQTGSGTAFEYRSPGSFGFDLNQTATSLDFFRVMSNTSDHAFGGGFSRTGSSSGSLFDQGDTWPTTTAYNFPFTIPQPSANPVNPNVLMFGSNGGRVYRSTDQGVTWVLKATPANLDGAAVLSTAFGSADPTKPTLTNNFLYAGTAGGNIYSSTTGGAPWTLIGSTVNGLDGQDIIRIIPNPQIQKKDVFALTPGGIFYKADGTVPTGSWIPLTGNLFNLTRSVFGNPADLDPALRPNTLSALAVDWRYALPQPGDPSNTFPYLYVAGDGGVFRSVDFGTTWTFFPDVANDGAPADGGYLPNTHITDLDLSIGDLDSSTGRYKPGGFNMLVASTYGRGSFAIRLDPDIPAASFVSGPRVTQLINPNPVGGPSASLNVRFSGPVDPATFTPEDILLLGPGSQHEVQAVTVVGGTTGNEFTLTFKGQTTTAIPYGSSASVVQAALNQLPIIGANGVGVVSATVPGGLRYTVTFSGPSVQYNNQDEMTATGTGFPDPTVLTVQDGSTPIPVTSVNMISTPNAQGVNPRNLFAIAFPAQSGTGSYDITIGWNPLGGNIPLISDPSGFLMNQDGDTVNGEPVVDQYRSTIQLNSATNNRLVVASAPATAVAGESKTVVIEARDANDLLLNGVNGTLTLTPAPGTGTFTPSTAQLVNGVATFTVVYQTSGPQTVNVSFSAPPSINPTAWTTTVVAGAATQFILNPASSFVTASTSPKSFTITAQDQFGNTATSYNQTVTLTRTGAAATLPATVNVVNGTASFNGVFAASGSVQITATGPDPANPPTGTITGNANVTVAAGTATQLGVTITPGPYSVGTTATVTVRALDALGNVASNLNGTGVVRNVGPATGFTLNPVTNPVFVNGVATYTITFTSAGSYTITHTANGPISAVLGPINVTAAPPPPSPTDNLPSIYGVGSGVSGTSNVSIFNGNGTLRTTLTPFPAGYHNEVDPAGSGFLGGIRVAVGDVTGDGVPDYVMGTGPTITASVVVVNGKTGATVLDYRPFEDFKGGVFATVGDITGDGINEIVMTPDEGGGPRVTILRGGDFTRIGNFFGINDPNFRGGARPAVGDINGDGFAELVISAGFGGGPRISVFDGAALANSQLSHPVGDFFLFEPELRNGAYVAVGDVDGDGFGDLAGGAGPGGGPRVLVISGKKLLEAGPNGSPAPALAAPIANFFAGNPDNRGGVRVATKNIDGDRKAELVTGAGGTDENGNLGGSTVSVYLGTDLDANNYSPLTQFDLLVGYYGGVFVG